MKETSPFSRDQPKNINYSLGCIRVVQWLWLILAFSGFFYGAKAQTSERSLPDRGTSFCPCDTLVPTELAQLELSALRGDKMASDTIYFYFTSEKYSPPDRRYWAQIAAENGNVRDQMEFARLLQGFLTSDLSNTRPFNDVIRSFFWAEVASEDPLENYNSSPPQLFISDHNTLKQAYWRAIANKKGQNHWIVNEAKNLISGQPIMIESIDGIELNQDHRFRCRGDGKRNPYNRIILNFNNIPAVQINALLGDCDAAVSLTEYFQKNGDRENYNYWLLISAENGDGGSQLALAKAMFNTNSEDEKVRGQFWERRRSSQ